MHAWPLWEKGEGGLWSVVFTRVQWNLFFIERGTQTCRRGWNVKSFCLVSSQYKGVILFIHSLFLLNHSEGSWPIQTFGRRQMNCPGWVTRAVKVGKIPTFTFMANSDSPAHLTRICLWNVRAARGDPRKHKQTKQTHTGRSHKVNLGIPPAVWELPRCQPNSSGM